MMDKQKAVNQPKICFINLDSKTLEPSVAFFEKRLDFFLKPTVRGFNSLETARGQGPWDLMILNASHLKDEPFLQWLKGLINKIEGKPEALTPALILSRTNFDSLSEIWGFAYEKNCYFDIMHPEHMDSLPIRVGNLLKFHDHIRELHRYETELEAIKQRLSKLESTRQ